MAKKYNLNSRGHVIFINIPLTNFDLNVDGDFDLIILPINMNYNYFEELILNLDNLDFNRIVAFEVKCIRLGSEGLIKSSQIKMNEQSNTKKQIKIEKQVLKLIKNGLYNSNLLYLIESEPVSGFFNPEEEIFFDLLDEISQNLTINDNLNYDSLALLSTSIKEKPSLLAGSEFLKILSERGELLNSNISIDLKNNIINKIKHFFPIKFYPTRFPLIFESCIKCKKMYYHLQGEFNDKSTCINCLNN